MIETINSISRVIKRLIREITFADAGIPLLKPLLALRMLSYSRQENGEYRLDSYEPRLVLVQNSGRWCIYQVKKVQSML